MELMPWRPFGELTTLRREMDNLWNRFFGEASVSRGEGKTWLPSMDVSETDNEILIKAELPGMEAKDVSVSLVGDLLTVKGERKEEKEEKGEKQHYKEISYGSFERSIRIPVTIKAEKVDANFDKGILTIKLPKSEEAKKKEIQVKVS